MSCLVCGSHENMQFKVHQTECLLWYVMNSQILTNLSYWQESNSGDFECNWVVKQLNVWHEYLMTWFGSIHILFEALYLLWSVDQVAAQNFVCFWPGCHLFASVKSGMSSRVVSDTVSESVCGMPGRRGRTKRPMSWAKKTTTFARPSAQLIKWFLDVRFKRRIQQVHFVVCWNKFKWYLLWVLSLDIWGLRAWKNRSRELTKDQLATCLEMMCCLRVFAASVVCWDTIWSLRPGTGWGAWACWEWPTGLLASEGGHYRLWGGAWAGDGPVLRVCPSAAAGTPQLVPWLH